MREFPVKDELDNLVGTHSIPITSELRFDHPAVRDGEPLIIRSGANSITWNYKLNTTTTPTIGGEVVQVLSCYVGPITIEGLAAGMSTGKDQKLPAGWGPGAFTPTDEISEIMLWFIEYMHVAGGGRKRRIEEAIKFTYPARGWVFYIQVTNLQGFDLRRDQVAIPWQITAEIVDDPGLDYFISETMSQYTDSLVSRAALHSAISKDFGFITNPFINPQLNTQVSTTDIAARLGDNFQALVAAWSYGDFSIFQNTTYSALADPRRQTGVDNPYDYYIQLVGGTYIGDPSKIKADYNAPFYYSGQSPTRGRTTISTKLSPTEGLYGERLKTYLVCRSRELNLDPAAILANVEQEGGWDGKVGDNGTSFGPFQLHIGGKLPPSIAAKGADFAREWANSVAGIDFALEWISRTAAGLKGQATIDAIVEWEVPARMEQEKIERGKRLTYWETYAANVNCSGSEPLLGNTVPNLGPVWAGGQSVLLKVLTHATSGLPLFPAFDDAFKLNEPIFAPEDMVVDTARTSADFGKAFYATGESKLRYWIGHLDRDYPLGTFLRKGQVIGRTVPYPPSVPHVHVGINIELIAGAGKELKYHKGAPTVGQQLAEILGAKFDPKKVKR